MEKDRVSEPAGIGRAPLGRMPVAHANPEKLFHCFACYNLTSYQRNARGFIAFKIFICIYLRNIFENSLLPFITIKALICDFVFETVEFWSRIGIN